MKTDDLYSHILNVLHINILRKGVGKAGKMWTTKLGWIARDMIPLQVNVWRDIPKPRKAAMVTRLKATR